MNVLVKCLEYTFILSHIFIELGLYPKVLHQVPLLKHKIKHLHIQKTWANGVSPYPDVITPSIRVS